MGYMLALSGIALMIILSGAGSAMGVAAGGSAVLGMMKKRPEAFGSGLVISGLPATQGLYGFVAFIMYSANVSPEMSDFQGPLLSGLEETYLIAMP